MRPSSSAHLVWIPSIWTHSQKVDRRVYSFYLGACITYIILIILTHTFTHLFHLCFKNFILLHIDLPSIVALGGKNIWHVGLVKFLFKSKKSFCTTFVCSSFDRGWLFYFVIVYNFFLLLFGKLLCLPQFLITVLDMCNTLIWWISNKLSTNMPWPSLVQQVISPT